MSYIYVFKIELDVRRIGNKNDIEIHKYCLVHYENQLYTTLQNKYFQGNVSLIYIIFSNLTNRANGMYFCIFVECNVLVTIAF